MNKATTTAPQDLSAAHLNIFFAALQAQVSDSKLVDEAKLDLLKGAPHEFLPIKDAGHGDIVPDPERKLPATFEELKTLVEASKRLIRGGNETPWLDNHAERLTYARIFDGALAAVANAMGMPR